jgi:hypothetical protein
MLRKASVGLIILCAFGNACLYAQSPTAIKPATSASSPPVVLPAPSPTPTRSPTTEELIESLTSADVQTAISLLKSNFTNPEAINETQLSRATLQGLIVRLNNGLLLLPGKDVAPPEPTAPFYSEILEGHVGYLRAGALTTPNLQALDKKLTEFGENKVDALVLDLRASGSSDFGIAAEFAKRFVTKGKSLFALRKQGKQERSFAADRDSVYNGLIVLLADRDTYGGAEAVAAALRFHSKALIIGQATAGRAVQYSDLPLPSGKVLRIAVAECTGPDGKSLYPGGAKPDLPVELAAVDKRQIFVTSASKGMGPFIHDTERPHLNEAALIAGTNPELETSEQRRGRTQATPVHDSVLQRALDLITSLEIYQKR